MVRFGQKLTSALVIETPYALYYLRPSNVLVSPSLPRQRAI